MRLYAARTAAALSVVIAGAVAHAQPAAPAPDQPGAATPDDAVGQPAGPPGAAVAGAPDDGVADRVEDLEDEVEDLRAELADMRERQAARTEPVRLNLLNPQITAFANAAARIDDASVLSAEGVPIDNRLFLRSAEVDFRAAVDPYADGVITLAIEDEAGEGFEADLEEAYLILKRLPIVDAAPLGLKLKLGRYRAAIGSVNRLHMHDLPWTTRPLPIVELLGTEQGEFFESGFNPEGVSAEFFLPPDTDSAVMELSVDVVDGGDIAISSGDRTPGFAGRFNLFATVADGHDLNLGLSGYYEPGDRRAGLVAADLMYKWKPLRAGEFRSLVVGGEVFYADRRFGIDTDGDGEVDADASAAPLGWYAFLQYQLSWHLYAGARFDYAQKVDDPDVATQVAAVYATYYTSEFLRFRVGYEHRRSDIAADDGVNSVLFDVNFVIGSHPTEPYWVNR